MQVNQEETNINRKAVRTVTAAAADRYGQLFYYKTSYMKKYVILFFLLQSILGHSQITFDFQSPDYLLQTIRISDTETKYCNNYFINPITEFNIYNLDGSIYKTIQFTTPHSLDHDLTFLN